MVVIIIIIPILIKDVPIGHPLGIRVGAVSLLFPQRGTCSKDPRVTYAGFFYLPIQWKSDLSTLKRHAHQQEQLIYPNFTLDVTGIQVDVNHRIDNDPVSISIPLFVCPSFANMGRLAREGNKSCGLDCSHPYGLQTGFRPLPALLVAKLGWPDENGRNSGRRSWGWAWSRDNSGNKQQQHNLAACHH